MGVPAELNDGVLEKHREELSEKVYSGVKSLRNHSCPCSTCALMPDRHTTVYMFQTHPRVDQLYMTDTGKCVNKKTSILLGLAQTWLSEQHAYGDPG